VSLGENHELSIGTRVNIASCLSDAHRDAEACEVYAETIARISTHLGDDHPLILTALINSSAAYRGIDDKESALRNIQRAVDISTKLLGPKHSMTLTAINALGATYQVYQDFEEAESVMEAAITLCAAGAEESAPTYLSLLSNLGNCKRMLQKYQESLPLGKKAVELRVKYLGMDHVETLRSQMMHAALLVETQDAQGAYPLLDHVLKTVKRKYPGEKQMLYEAYTIMGNTVMKFEGRMDEGFQYMVLAAEGYEELLGKDHETTKQVCRHLSGLYGQVGDSGRAKHWSERGGEVYGAQPAQLAQPSLQQQLIAQGELLWAQNQHMPAMEYFGLAIEEAGVTTGPESEEVFNLLNGRAMRFMALQMPELAKIDHMAAIQLIINVQGIADHETVGSIAAVTKVYTDQQLQFENYQHDLCVLGQQLWDAQSHTEGLMCMGHAMRQAMAKHGVQSVQACEVRNRRALFLLQAGAIDRAKQDHLASAAADRESRGAGGGGGGCRCGGGGT
jgi:tetratricopeptide (TPR) repeat protein